MDSAMAISMMSGGPESPMGHGTDLPGAREVLLALLIVLVSGLRQSRFERGKEASCFASGYDTVIEG